MPFVVVYRHANGSLNFVHEHVGDDCVPTEFDTWSEGVQALKEARADDQVKAATLVEIPDDEPKGRGNA